MNNQAVFSFIGWGETPGEAVDGATGKANEWLTTHAWRTADGLPCYVMTTTLMDSSSAQGLWFVYIITFYGPDKETAPIREHSYTGTTERLR